MSANYETIKRNYDSGFYTKKILRLLVSRKLLTKDEYREITGEEYDN